MRNKKKKTRRRNTFGTHGLKVRGHFFQDFLTGVQNGNQAIYSRITVLLHMICD